MASTMDKLSFRYAQLSPAMKFGVIGIAILIGFLIWDSTISPIQTAWTTKGDQIERQLRQVNNLTELRREIDDVRGAIRSFGPVEPPTNATDAAAALEAEVNALLREFERDISDDNLRVNRVERLPRDVLAGSILGPNEVAQRHAYTLEFTATPDVVTKILLRLEASPAVESIASIRIKREQSARPGKKEVSVRMEMEAWSRAPRNS